MGGRFDHGRVCAAPRRARSLLVLLVDSVQSQLLLLLLLFWKMVELVLVLRPVASRDGEHPPPCD